MYSKNPKLSRDWKIVRIEKADLKVLSVDGYPCEVCGRHMHKHQWVDLDTGGFVVACSFQKSK